MRPSVRSLLLGVVAAAACSTPVAPLGIYRFPLQTGPSSVQLRTVMAGIAANELVLYDGASGREFARGIASTSWDGRLSSPFRFDKLNGQPLTIAVQDGVLQDALERPYSVVPVPALRPRELALRRARLASGGQARVLVVAGEHVFAEEAEPQPAAGAAPSLLSALNSVAGTGLVLPADLAEGSEWFDAWWTYVPPSAQRPVACAAPILGRYSLAGTEEVQVPAGTYAAAHVVEVVKACEQPNAPDVAVVRVDRWFVRGLGPVRVHWTSSDGGVHQFKLAGASVQRDSQRLWPLEPGNAWTFEVVAPNGARGAPAQVTVEKVDRVAADVEG